jgi:chromosomal replication initiator protein
MALLEDRLTSRFVSGLLTEVNPPDYETRMAIIDNKARELGFQIPDDAARYIAENMTANIRQLEGAVTRIRAYRDLLNQSNLSQTSVTQIVKDIIHEAEKSVTVDIVVEETAKTLGVEPAVIKGPSRAKTTATARHIAIYLIRTLTPLSLKDIGAVFQGRDHATVLNSIANVEKRMDADTRFAQTVRDIMANIYAKTE